jgi:hypothetical protein
VAHGVTRLQTDVEHSKNTSADKLQCLSKNARHGCVRVVASESSNPAASLTLTPRTEGGDQYLLPLSEQTTRQLQKVIAEFNQTRDLLFERPWSAMLQ